MESWLQQIQETTGVRGTREGEEEGGKDGQKRREEEKKEERFTHLRQLHIN